jgi:hypothetical protein
MIQAALGIIDKMRIEVYEKSDYKGDPRKTIFVQLNPEKYSIKHNVVFYEGQAMGAVGNDLKFNKIEGEEVSFDYIFDSSGVVPPGKIIDGKGEISLLTSVGDAIKPALANPFEETKTVEKEVEEFRKLLMGYIGTSHQTSYLKLLWGGFTLNCRLKSMEIEYSLFRKDGRPIRAKVKCLFKGTVSYEVMLSEQNKTSPDLTHERIVTMNDKLSILAEDIYKNANYYIDVSKANNLLSFRNIKTGQRVQFPPIK